MTPNDGGSGKLSKSARRRRNKRRRHAALLAGADAGAAVAAIAPENHAAFDDALDRAAKVFVDHALKPRDLPVLAWLCASLKITPAVYFGQVLRSAVVAEKSNWREAIGQGGASSRNLDKLAERLPVHKVPNA